MRVRQAIAYAIDRDAIVQATSYGTAAANQLAIPEGNPWYTPYDTYRYDVDRRPRNCCTRPAPSRDDLDMLVTSEYPETVTAAQVIADNLAPLGITVNIRTVDFATWLDEQNSGNFDMLMMGWLGNIDPDDFYYAQHHTDGAKQRAEVLQPRGRPPARRRPRRDRPRPPATTTTPRPPRIIADEVSYIYLYNPSVIQAWNPALSGYEARRDGAIRFRTASSTRTVADGRDSPDRSGFLARRLLYSLVVLLGVLVVVFALVHLVPGDPVRIALGTRYTPGGLRRAAVGQRPGPADRRSSSSATSARR